MVIGPMSDANGGFYSGIDAETDGIEGEYYVWSAEELQRILDEDEIDFFTTYFALADVPKFPGHKHANGQVIIARKPLDVAALEHHLPYAQMAALTAQVMNKLLAVRNVRAHPAVDTKIITAWNGLMIDALAKAGHILKEPRYILRARKAAEFLLENAIDNEGTLHRIYADGKPQLLATLEDYAFLVQGLISLWRAAPDKELLDSIASLQVQAEVLFGNEDGGYFFAQDSKNLLMRIKHGDDSAIPGANGVMLANLVSLYEISGNMHFLAKAEALANYFLSSDKPPTAEASVMMSAAIALLRAQKQEITEALTPSSPTGRGGNEAESVTITYALFPLKVEEGIYELAVGLEMNEGWHININRVEKPYLITTQLDVQGHNVELIDIRYPKPKLMMEGEGIDAMPVYTGVISIYARIRLPLGQPRPNIKAMLRFQPCKHEVCHEVRDVVIEI
jgi:uncharacterized protein YyaL (SSP411 family)